MKIAVLADLHLVDISDTVKENVLEQALKLIKSSDVDAVICAGDMISAAANEALNRLNDKLCALKIPFIYAFGNTENAIPDPMFGMAFVFMLCYLVTMLHCYNVTNEI